VSATLAVAIVGAVTGILGLAWQFVNFYWSGARVQLFALRWRQEGDSDSWWIRTEVSNVGRLDATVVGYSVWVGRRDYRRRRFLWRIHSWPKMSWRVSRRMLPVTAPSVVVGSPGKLWYDPESGEPDSVEFPLTVRPGQSVNIPQIGMGWTDSHQVLHVAVQLGSGRIVTAEPLDSGRLRPFETSL
jgi:hypothetical protein